MTAVHTCHWPGCEKHCAPARWGCSGHWFTLPKEIRDRIWAAYVPGQEITKTPSKAYLAVAREADVFAREFNARKEREQQARGAPPQATLF
jgi:hypothetical protein